MKTKPFFILLILAYASVMSIGSSPYQETFVSASPCDAVARHYLDIPKDMDCEMIKWRLTLFKDQRNESPTLFELTYTYGMTKPGTKGFMNEGFTKELRGKWSVTKSKAQVAGTQVFELTPNSGQPKFSFLRLDENILQLLDLEGKLMIGNAGFSYTMNKL